LQKAAALKIGYFCCVTGGFTALEELRVRQGLPSLEKLFKKNSKKNILNKFSMAMICQCQFTENMETEIWICNRY
jgi:hypothetical protein